MSLTTVLTLLAAIGTAAVLGYWHLREQRQTIDKTKSKHSPSLQLAIRWLFPLIGGVLILQLVDIVTWKMPLPSGLTQDLFMVGQILFWVGAGLAIWSRQVLGTSWAHAADFQLLPKQTLITSGPYRWIRHPIYSSFLLMFLAVELMTTSWLILLLIPLVWFVIWQSRKEETLLVQAFGDTYLDYMKHTGMLMPRFR
jgi:protein-S-isoprenylcysteine O-methyltransferase Ste14